MIQTKRSRPAGNGTASKQVGETVTSLPLTAGVTLRAVDALQVQETFTADQVAYLAHLAYETGRRHAAAEDLAETIACWREFAEPRRTRAERVADRMADMDAYARTRAEREGRPYRVHPGGPVNYETGEPVRRLEVAA